MNYLTPIVGFIAAILTTIAFVPQIIRVWRTRSAEDISLGMYTLFTPVSCYGWSMASSFTRSRLSLPTASRCYWLGRC
jgi:uncharacterized protein with PQ loop repeat